MISSVPLVEAFIINHTFGVVRLSETLLDSIVPINDGNIAINGCSLLRADYPKTMKRVAVWIYFKEPLPLIKRNHLTNMKECLLTEVNIN